VLLEVRDLHVSHDRAECLKGISMAVEEGSVVSIVGANGAGKTTFLKTISGLHKPVRGSITFLGRRIDGMPGDQVARAGIVQVPEGRMVFAPMTVEDNLLVGAHMRDSRRDVAKDMEAVFERFPDLRHKRRQMAGSLSGGQQQMLAVGRALMARPKLLLMDEPSIGLSPLMVAEVGRIIKDINREGIAIVLVEQNARMALKLSERAYILEIGTITLEGKAEDIARDERVKKAYLGG